MGTGYRSQPTGRASRHLSSILPRLVRVLTLYVAFSAVALAEVENSARDTPTPSAARTGELLIRHRDASGMVIYHTSVHLGSTADISVTGMVATVSLRQQFRNTESTWAEAVYVFPLPENAAVSYMEMQIGQRRIVGEIKERAEARAIYQQAKQSGRKAALVEQQRPNLFTQSVANIAPGESISVTLRYQQPVRYDQGEFSLTLPTTLTPRYIPGAGPAGDDETRLGAGDSAWGWSTPTDQVPDADRITPFMITTTQGSGSRPNNQIALDVIIDSGLPLARIDSPYHDIRVEKRGRRHHVTTRSGTVPMDRDFVLRWQAAAGRSPDAAAFTETFADDSGEQDYALLMLLPPQQTAAGGNSLPRQVIFIIDTSGSMQGTSIIQARQSLQLALTRLKPADEFDIIEFNSSYSRLFGDTRPANLQNVQRAQQFVAALQANGGTEMEPALRAALTTPRRESLLTQIVFITDGSVGNESALFELIHSRLQDGRLFTVGIGSAPNSFFMRKAAEFGRGTVTYIGDTSEVAGKMGQLFSKLESPVMTDLTVSWPDDLKAEVWPQQIPDLYQGEPLVLYAKFDHPLSAGEHTITVTGRTASETWQHALLITKQEKARKKSGDHPIARLWARKKIEALLDEKVRGRDGEQVREDVLKLALSHQLLSPYTSFVAVEKRISRPDDKPLRNAPVPNLAARGQTMLTTQPVPLPQTAAGLDQHLIVALVAGLLFLLLRRRQGMPA